MKMVQVLQQDSDGNSVGVAYEAPDEWEPPAEWRPVASWMAPASALGHVAETCRDSILISTDSETLL